MRRVIVGVVAAMFYLSTALAGTASAHSFVDHPHLTIHKSPAGATAPGDAVVVYGKLKSDHFLCRFNQPVRLWVVRPGNDKFLDSDKTDRQGEYSFTRHPHRDRTFYTRFPGFFESSYGHSHRCVKDRSPDLLIDVTS